MTKKPPTLNEMSQREGNAAPSLGQLVDDLLQRFHQPVRTDLRELIALGEALASGDETVRRVCETLTEFEADLLAHMLKEERILFPFFLAMDRAREDPAAERVRTHFGTVQNPIGVMLADHVRSGEILKLLNRLIAELREVGTDSEERRVFFERLAAFERHMREHIRIEEQVIFPMAIRLERKLGWHVF